ncbi:MAG: hypothetical protein EU532_13445, partial [Promethearchaeota archaeon]
MKFDKKTTKSTIILLVIIVSTFIQVSNLSFYNGNIDNENQNEDEDRDENDHIQKTPIHISSNPPDVNYFGFYKVITIYSDKVAANLTNFPVFISLIDSDLKDQVQPDGDDIAFWNGSEWLDHEIELYDPNYNPSEAQLIAWVR